MLGEREDVQFYTRRTQLVTVVVAQLEVRAVGVAVRELHQCCLIRPLGGVPRVLGVERVRRKERD